VTSAIFLWRYRRDDTPLQAVDEPAQLHRRRILHQQVDMVVRALEFSQVRAEVPNTPTIGARNASSARVLSTSRRYFVTNTMCASRDRLSSARAYRRLPIRSALGRIFQ
jgi:hypothetical protein